MNNKFYIKTTSRAQIAAIFGYFNDLGFKSAFDFDVAKYHEIYPIICFDLDAKDVGGYCDYQEKDAKKYYTKISFSDIFTLDIPAVEIVVLNPQYTAEVSKDGVKVGCTVFPLDIIDSLREARDKILK